MEALPDATGSEILQIAGRVLGAAAKEIIMAEQRSTARGRGAWKSGSSGTAAASRPGSKKRRIFWLTATVLALVGVIAAFFSIVKPARDTEFVPLVMTQYNPPHLVAKPGAARDGGELKDIFISQEHRKTRFSDDPLAQNNYANQAWDTLDRRLKELQQGDRYKDKDTVLVYLNALALTDQAGAIHVLPADANPDNPNSWKPLKDILSGLKDCPAHHKVVILDLMHPPLNPRLGVLSHDVAMRVVKTVNEVPDEHRLVILPCSPGQVSLASEDLNQSVFGYYLQTGLRGAAARYGNGPDNLVTAERLVNFLKERVDRWADQNRHTRQTPLVLGNLDLKFDLMTLPRTGLPSQTQLPQEVEPYPSWLSEKWALRDQWWDEKKYRIAPWTFRKLEALLLQAEQKWRGGALQELDKDILNSTVRDLQAKMSQAEDLIKGARPPASSLAMERAQGGKPGDPQVVKALQALLVEEANLAADPKPDYAAFREKRVKPFLEAVPKPPAEDKAKPPDKEPTSAVLPLKDRPFDLAWAVFEAARQETTPRPQRIHFLNQLLLDAGQSPPRYVETLFLERLDDELGQRGKADAKNWDPRTVRAALDAVWKGEIAAACDERAFAWVHDGLEEAAQKRHDAAVLLFARDYAPPATEDLFKEVSGRYEALEEPIGRVTRAYQAYDRAMIVLPDFLPYLMALPDLGNLNRENWQQCRDAVLGLQPILANPPRSGSANDEARRNGLRKLDRLTEVLEPNLTRILNLVGRDQLDARLGAARKADVTSANDRREASRRYVEANQLLELPWLRAKDREEAWQAIRELAHRLNDETLKADQASEASRQLGELAQTFQEDKAVQEEHQRTAWRAELAINLLRLGGVPGAAQLEPERLKAAQSAKDSAAWPALAVKVHKAWTGDLKKALENPAADRDRLSRIFPPLDELSLPQTTANPTADLFKTQVRDLRKWLAERYLYESRELVSLDVRSPADRDKQGKTRAQSFYARAAGQLSGEAPDVPLRIDPSPDPVDPRTTHEESLDLHLASGVSPNDVTKFDKIVDPSWLTVKLPEPADVMKEPGPDYKLRVGIELAPGAQESTTERPKGFLITAVVRGKTYHFVERTELPEALGRSLQLIATGPDKNANLPLRDLRLRPNAGQQQVYLFVKNPTDQPRTVAVELKAGKPLVSMGRSDPIEAPPGGKPMPVKFPGAAPMAQLDELKGPLEMTLLDVKAGDKPIGRPQVFDVVLDRPSDYVTADVRYYPKDHKLTVKVLATKPIQGKPCRVALELLPEQIPGLTTEQNRKGQFGGELTAENPTAELFAENLDFSDRDQEYGYVHLTVDGWKRALVYRVPFPIQGVGFETGELVIRPQPIRLKSKDVARTGTPYRVDIEADNAPADAQLEVALDTSGGGNFVRKSLLQGGRQERKGFSPHAPDGALLFDTSVRDWEYTLDTTGIVRECTLRVRMLHADGKLVTGGPDDQELLTTKAIIFDDTKPVINDLKLVNRPRKSILRLSADGNDPESGIDTVEFFPGEPATDAKTGEQTVGNNKTAPGKPVDAAKKRWQGDLSIAPDAKGLMTVSVRFVNRAGLDQFKTVQIDLGGTDEGDGKKPTTATIKVRLVARGQAQEKQQVLLTKDMAKEPTAQMDTDDKGLCVFKNVQPGKYKLSASVTKSTETLKADVIVEVAAGDEIQKELDAK
jgi:hypothetical protein